MGKYPTLVSFISAVTPDRQRDWCYDERKCHLGNFPTLQMLDTGYGKLSASTWLIPQLENLSEFCGVNIKMEANTLVYLADVIAAQYPFLKVSEIALFCFKFKAGDYGKMYGRVDPLVITTGLKQFLKDREDALQRFQREDNNEQAGIKTMEYYAALRAQMQNRRMQMECSAVF